jgi:hypothetical protein
VECDVNVALVSAPWHLENRPSLALGALKGHLAKHGVPQDVHHLHLTIAARLGLYRYHHIAMDLHLAESLYATLVARKEHDEIIGRLVRRLKETGRADAASWITP